MDPQTSAYYREHAADLVQRYSRASSMESQFPLAFPPGSRVLDVGAGSGRDVSRLLALGLDAYGVEPCAELRAGAVALYPELAGRLAPGQLPDLLVPRSDSYRCDAPKRRHYTCQDPCDAALGRPFGGGFDGVLCSAVLMHLPQEALFDAAFAIRSVLKEGGRLLLSVPRERPGLDEENRDAGGRLFTPLNADYLALLFERLGFQLLSRTQSGDARPGYSWWNLLFELQRSQGIRPIDQIEGILTRDKKTATYKLALFRALAEIATSPGSDERWGEDGTVRVALAAVAERWLYYYWPLFEAPVFIPQIRHETPGGPRPIAFRAGLTALVARYRKHGGLPRFIHEYRSRQLGQEAGDQVSALLGVIGRTIVSGPVKYAGGSLESGSVFGYDARTREVLVPAGIWRDLALLGHWIQDAVILRWAELTAQISRGALGAGEVAERLLAAPVPEREVGAAREVYLELPHLKCAWTGRPVQGRLAVTRIIPFSLWRGNDLWNLVPADPAVNRRKSNRLPARELLCRREESIVHCWEALRRAHPVRFSYEGGRLLGREALPGDWQRPLFRRVAEAVEVMAIQRGAERWMV